MRFVFFSMRDFTRDAGDTIRMYGMLNALAAKNCDVIFISNAKNKDNFHDSILHIPINYTLTNKQKAIFQLLVSFMPVIFVRLFYCKFFKHLSSIMSEVIKSNETVYFFEYLDNSIAYVLKKKNIISAYINDIHGIAPIEFEMQIALPSDVKRKLLNHFKYLSACMLDKKVFNYGDGFIYASNEMKKYYEKTTLKSHQSKPYVIIPYLLDFVECSDKLDLELKNALKEQFQIQQDDFVFMFAGGYKRTAGVDDLIIAFKQLSLAYKNIKLILIGKEGDSYTYENCRKLACDSDKNIFFIDSIPYEKLYTYQNIANVVICPDKMNPYSNIIVHVKYLDALASGKLVINGSFESVMEINKNNFLSLTFEPSNIDSLRETMKNCIDNYNSLIIKYKDTEKYTRKNLTYSSYIDVLINNNNGS